MLLGPFPRAKVAWSFDALYKGQRKQCIQY